MEWVVLNYSLPTKQGSSSRVALWRRLQRLGVISMAGGAYILPVREECVEAFQWLAQEIHSSGGEALIMRVEHFEGLTDPQIVQLFDAERAKDYADLNTEIDELNKNHPIFKSENAALLQGAITKLRRRYTDIACVDYFNSDEGKETSRRLGDLERHFSPASSFVPPVPSVNIDHYRDKDWVTRPHLYIDRLACIWLIRHFINPKATIRYSMQPRSTEVAFDMTQGEFGHRGSLCTFESMKLAFGLNDPGLRPLAEIVHEIDLRDSRYAWPETAGIERILSGWVEAGLSDQELESRGVSLFEGLNAAFSRESKHTRHPQDRSQS